MPGRDTFIIVLVGLLVLTAGCSGSPDGGTPTSQMETQTTTLPDESSTTSDASSTTTDGTTATPPTKATPTATTTQTDREGELPPLASRDWMADGRLNLSALYLTHIEALRAASGYQVQTNFTYTLENGSKSVTEFNTLVDADRAVLKMRRDNRWDFDQAFFTRRYATERSAVIIKQFENGTVRERSRFSPSEPFNQTIRQVSVEDIGLGMGINLNWTADGQAVLDGHPVYRYRGIGFANSSQYASQATLSSATMLVDQSGRIRHISFDAQGEFSFGGIEGRFPATFSFNTTLSNLNSTTVEAPPWVESGN